ncbi:SFT2 domain-containing protein [Histoplasma capsulatum H143]|uniref:SFT2 domain-containing protein n=1 Tax=Ajellomyces capsulatus (strain H143) TaxID=544712 RepID=C6HJ74_AJECH|nr:SFT2 domain-containing protein [Histoplasma capsulatum H143]
MSSPIPFVPASEILRLSLDASRAHCASDYISAYLIFTWSVGSVLFLISWAVLMGPMAYVKHLASGPRLPFTGAYFTSIGLTLYFAIGKFTPIVLISLLRYSPSCITKCFHPSNYYPPDSTYIP